jgi:bifunctional DNA-binding transcriptional regulator/antitoxin component of YhaV-PrlF toxin-antitoxin module
VEDDGRLVLPSALVRAAGFRPGDPVAIRVEGRGHLAVEPESDVVAEFAGVLARVYRAHAAPRVPWR